MGYALVIAGAFFLAEADYLDNKTRYIADLFKAIGFLSSGNRYYLGWLIVEIFDWVDFGSGVSLIILDFVETFTDYLEFDESTEIVMAILSVLTGILSIFLAWVALVLLGGHSQDCSKTYTGNKMRYDASDKSNVALLFGVGNIILGSIFLATGYTLLVSE